MKRLVGAALALSTWCACGGSIAPSTGSAHETGGEKGSDAATPDAHTVVDAGIQPVPTNHRPSGSTCPQGRGAGMLEPGCADAGIPFACTLDSECTMGSNGRCLPAGPLPCDMECSYDTCTDDSQCSGNIPCICRTSASDPTANVCATGSQCRVDADCGPGGYCSPSDTMSCTTAYFCHTPSDICVNDSDCNGTGGCNYDATQMRWQCVDNCIPPP
jgi:hypothetical protein